MYFMTIEQTVDIPANRLITLEVPKTVPVGKTILSFTPVSVSQSADISPRTTAEARQMAAAKAADPNRKPFSRHFGTLSPSAYGDGVAYQRAIRDEWDD
jgi:hypothetical protein